MKRSVSNFISGSRNQRAFLKRARAEGSRKGIADSLRSARKGASLNQKKDIFQFYKHDMHKLTRS